jgi:hypothetical protein
LPGPLPPPLPLPPSPPPPSLPPQPPRKSPIIPNPPSMPPPSPARPPSPQLNKLSLMALASLSWTLVLFIIAKAMLDSSSIIGDSPPLSWFEVGRVLVVVVVVLARMPGAPATHCAHVRRLSLSFPWMQTWLPPHSMHRSLRFP